MVRYLWILSENYIHSIAKPKLFIAICSEYWDSKFCSECIYKDFSMFTSAFLFFLILNMDFMHFLKNLLDMCFEFF